MTCAIYKITENETGRCYIGQSKNVEKRWKSHYKRFPPELFSYEILLKCDADVLDFFEKAFIDGYDSHRCGFNRTLGGTAIRVRYPDAETRQKMSEAGKGKTRPPFSEEHRRKLSEARKRRLPASEETRRKLSEAGKRPRKPPSEEARLKISEAAKAREAARRAARED